MLEILILFPTLLGANHLMLSAWYPTYSAFTTMQKCEWLAWTNTVIFQSSFTMLHLAFGVPGSSLGPLFVAYTLCDSALLPAYNTDMLLYVHHAVSLGVTGLFSYIGIADEATYAAVYLESSNILLGCTWLLNRAGYGKTRRIKLLGGIALLVYIVNRALLFPYHLVFLASWTVAIAMSPFLPMNYYWSYKLLNYYSHIAFERNVGG